MLKGLAARRSIIGSAFNLGWAAAALASEPVIWRDGRSLLRALENLSWRAAAQPGRPRTSRTASSREVASVLAPWVAASLAALYVHDDPATTGRELISLCPSRQSTSWSRLRYSP